MVKKTVAEATNQPTKHTKEITEGGDLRESASRRPSGCLAIPALTASLGSVTDTLNYNWDCAYANDFPSQLKTTWANGGPVAQEEISIMGGGTLLWLEGFLGFEHRMVTLKLKVD